MKLLAVAFALFAVAHGTHFIHEHHPHYAHSSGKVADVSKIPFHLPTDDVLLKALDKILNDFEKSLQNRNEKRNPVEIKRIAEALEEVVVLKSQVRQTSGKDIGYILQALNVVEDSIVPVLSNVEDEDRLIQATGRTRKALDVLEDVIKTKASELNKDERKELEDVHAKLKQLIEEIAESTESVDVLPVAKEVITVVKGLIDNLEASSSRGEFDHNLEGLTKGLRVIQDALNKAVHILLGIPIIPWIITHSSHSAHV